MVDDEAWHVLTCLSYCVKLHGFLRVFQFLSLAGPTSEKLLHVRLLQTYVMEIGHEPNEYLCFPITVHMTFFRYSLLSCLRSVHQSWPVYGAELCSPAILCLLWHKFHAAVIFYQQNGLQIGARRCYFRLRKTHAMQLCICNRQIRNL